MKFATKIGLSAAAISLIVGPLLGAAVFLEARSLLQEHIVREQMQTATSVMREIDIAMYRAYMDISMIAADELLQEAVESTQIRASAKAKLAKELEERERLTGPWRAMMVFDQKGRALFGPKPLGKTQQISDYPLNKIGFDHALQGQIYYSGQVICPRTHQPFVIFAAPVYARGNPHKVIGVVIAQYLWTSVQQILDHAASAARIYLLNHEGGVIGRRSGDQSSLQRMPLLGAAAIKNGMASYGIIASPAHGEGDALAVEMRQSGLQDYRGSGWILMMEQPLDVAFAPISEMARNTALLVFVILLLQAILLATLGRFFLRPLSNLLKGVKRVSSGDFNERLAVYGKDELSEFANNFNIMTDQLQLRTQQLLEAQDQLVHKEKLAMLGQLAENVGNELRNPLGVMSNAVYYLQAVQPDADGITKEYLDIIRNEIAGAERIVAGLLDAVRTNPPHLATVSVRELVSQTLSRCVIPVTVNVRQNLPEALPPVSADPLQMQQALRNLVCNSIEAMPEGGMLEIQAVANAADNTVAISVRDSGVGIAPEHLAKLFQPMFTTKSRGIGLGLVVVKNLMQANNGKVEVQSEVGKGATFTLTLPAALQQPE
ncbi:ATP-binding protein [Sulfuriferula sp. AH1]|uniref:ATP-binding protein n=1 Tax=Sulfuriferula sp. AH1 TaxID=1985873 RepID=UPI001678ACE3|nr:ATP-binding protein [Sulfuriferula sp. AH1]